MLLKQENQLSVSPDLIFCANIEVERLGTVVSDSTEVIPLDLGNIRFGSMLSNPFKEKSRISVLVREYKTLIQSKIGNRNGGKPGKIQVVIGSEKDLFTQILLHSCTKIAEEVEVIAVEEGLGYYGNASRKDNWMKLMYALVTPLLLGFHYQYFRVLGTHSMISTVFVRFPDQIEHLEGKKYVQMTGKIEKTYFPNGNLLLLTSPLSEDQYCSSEQEFRVIKIIYEVCARNGLLVTQKSHPRENPHKLGELNKDAEIIPQSVSAEQIEYSNFKAILNFNSSVIIDIFDAGYPLDKVITIELLGKINVPFLNHLYQRGTCIDGYSMQSETLDKVLKRLI